MEACASWTPQYFGALEANSEIAYKVDDHYAQESRLAWDVPSSTTIKWPIKAAEAALSENDRRRELVRAFVLSFRYDVG